MASFTPTDPLKAEVRVTGTAPNQVLDFYIPRGGKGDKGDQGTPNSLSVIGTTTGPETAGATGAQGIQGLKGDPGGFTSGTSIGTGDLNLLVAPGIYGQMNGALVLTTMNYPTNYQAPGVLTVYQNGSTGLQEWRTTYATPAGRVTYRRTWSGSGATWTAWVGTTSNRVSESAGRAIYAWDDLNNREQLVYGDTGWRDITATHILRHTSGTPMPISSGTLSIRRVGHMVQVSAFRLTLDRVAEPNELVRIVDAPGFAASASGAQAGHWPWSRWDMTGQYALIRTNGGWIPGSSPLSPFPVTGGQGGLTLHSWFTEQSWPTTLPGTAVGSIPNL